jgi:hypothetical protein
MATPYGALLPSRRMMKRTVGRRHRGLIAASAAWALAGCGSAGDRERDSSIALDAGAGIADLAPMEASAAASEVAFDDLAAPDDLRASDGVAPVDAAAVMPDEGAAADVMPGDAPAPTPPMEPRCDRSILRFPMAAEIAAYSRTLDKVIVGSAAHRALWITDVRACSARTLLLPRPALGLAVDVEGTHAVVGLAGGVVSVDLRTGELGKPIATPSEASGVVVDARGGIHTALVGGSDYAHGSPVISLDPMTGQTRVGPQVDNNGTFVPHPLGRRFYWVGAVDWGVTAFDVSTSTAVQTQTFLNRDLDTCGRMAFSTDGAQMVTGCGAVFRTTDTGFTPDPGRLEQVTASRDLHVAGGRVTLVPAPAVPYDPQNVAERQVRLYDLASRKLLRTFDPPQVDAGGPATPTRVFLNDTGTRVAVLLVRESYNNPIYALAQVGDDVPAVGPSPDAGVSPGAESGVVRDLPGVPPLEPMPAPRPLDIDVLGAASAPDRDLLLLASGLPTAAVKLANARTLAGPSLALPAVPRVVAVHEASGRFAVGHAKGVSIGELSGRLTGELMVEGVDRLLFAPDGRLWIITGMAYQHRLRIYDPVSGVLGQEVGDSFAPFEGLMPHPSGQRSYGAGRDLERLEMTTGFTAKRVETDLYGTLCAPLGFTESGEHLFTSCGRVFQLSPMAADDLRYAGALEGLARPMVATSLPGQKFVATGEPVQGELRVFSGPLWTIVRRFELPPLSGPSPAKARARFVLPGRNGSVHVIVREYMVPYGVPEWHAVVTLEGV